MSKDDAIKQLDDLILSTDLDVGAKHRLMNCVSTLIGISDKYDKCTTLFESKEIIILKK